MKIKRVFTGAGAGFLALVTVSAVAYVNAPGTLLSASTAVEVTSANTEGWETEASPADGDSRFLAQSQGEADEYKDFQATAYSDFGITYSGILVRKGMVAADPQILPIGSVIEVKAGSYSGIYTVMDTGGVVKGQLIDIFVPDFEEAVQFGRQNVKLRVLRRGWHPDAAPEFQYSLAG